MIAGPAYCAAAVPVSTKIPAPMIAPMPMAMMLPGPSERASGDRSASCTMRAIGLRAQYPCPAIALPRLPTRATLAPVSPPHKRAGRAWSAAAMNWRTRSGSTSFHHTPSRFSQLATMTRLRDAEHVADIVRRDAGAHQHRQRGAGGDGLQLVEARAVPGALAGGDGRVRAEELDVAGQLGEAAGPR